MRGAWRFTPATARLACFGFGGNSLYYRTIVIILSLTVDELGLLLQGDLCNEPTFLLAKFNEWISVTRARLKAGPSHPLDILITIATVAVGAFFFLVIASQLPIPWAKIFGKKKEEEDEDDDEEEEEDKADNEDTEEGEGGTAGHAKSE